MAEHAAAPDAAESSERLEDLVANACAPAKPVPINDDMRDAFRDHDFLKLYRAVKRAQRERAEKELADDNS